MCNVNFLQKGNEMNKDKNLNGYTEPEYINPDDESDFAYTIVTTNGKPKTLAWSVAALAMGILAVILSFLGWAGAIIGVIAIALSFIARKFLGFFNGFILTGMMTGIFGTVIGIALIIADYMNIF